MRQSQAKPQMTSFHHHLSQMMDSIEEMSHTTTDNNFDYSSSGKAFHLNQNYVIDSHCSQKRPTQHSRRKASDTLSSDILSP